LGLLSLSIVVVLRLQIGITPRIGTPSAVQVAFRAVMQDESTEVSW
jgi:hypothetical protein